MMARGLRSFHHRFDVVQESLELGEIELLFAVGQGDFWVRMNFDVHSVGSDRKGSFGKWCQDVAAACGVGDINNHGQVRLEFGNGNSGNVERVAGPLLERANATFTQNQAFFTSREDVLGGEHPLLHRLRESTFEENWPSGSSNFLEQREILCISRANLQDIGVLGDQIDISGVHDFGHEQHLVLLSGSSTEFQALFAHALETVRAGSRLVRAATQDFDTFAGQERGGALELFPAFNAARSSDQGFAAVTEDDSSAFVFDDNVGRFRFGFARVFQARFVLAFLEVKAGFENLFEQLLDRAGRIRTSVCSLERVEHLRLTGWIVMFEAQFGLALTNLRDDRGTAREEFENLEVNRVDLRPQGVNLGIHETSLTAHMD
jgi:hypothetical protein